MNFKLFISFTEVEKKLHVQREMSKKLSYLALATKCEWNINKNNKFYNIKCF